MPKTKESLRTAAVRRQERQKTAELKSRLAKKSAKLKKALAADFNRLKKVLATDKADTRKRYREWLAQQNELIAKLDDFNTRARALRKEIEDERLGVNRQSKP